MISSLFSSWLAQAAPTAEELQSAGHARLPDPDGAVLFLDRRDHVADPRRLHGVRGRRRATQERDVDGDEEHPHHRRRDAELLLLRLVHLRLLRRGLAEGRARQPDRRRARGSRGLLPEHGPLGGADGPEPAGSRQRRLLPRLPPLLLDDGIDHVGSAHRARPPLRVPDPRGRARLRRLDHGRRLGLERRRLADDALRLPRLDRVTRRARRRGSLHLRRPARISGRASASTRSRARRGPSAGTTRT